MIFYPKICWFTRFVVNCRESNLRTFCREIHQSAKIGGRGGREGQANLGNARIFTAFYTSTPPLVLIILIGGWWQHMARVAPLFIYSQSFVVFFCTGGEPMIAHFSSLQGALSVYHIVFDFSLKTSGRPSACRRLKRWTFSVRRIFHSPKVFQIEENLKVLNLPIWRIFHNLKIYQVKDFTKTQTLWFLATLVALHSTPVSE